MLRSRRPVYLKAFFFAAVILSAACSGGGSGAVSPTVGSPGSSTGSQSTSVSLSLAQSGSVTLPAVSGIASTIALSGNNAPPGAQLTVGVSANAPSNLPAIPAASSSAFEYFSLTASVDVTFDGFPKIAMTLPSAPKSQGQFYIWMYDPAAAAWTNLGTISVAGSSLSFGANAKSVTFKRNVTYVAIPFTGKAGASCPTPPPSPPPPPPPTPTPNPLPSCPPTPTPGPLFTGTKVYLTDDAYAGSSACNAVRVFDDSGNSVGTPASFPNVYTPVSITFDPLEHHLYVLNSPLNNDNCCVPFVTVYDESGNQIAASGGFPKLNNPASILFDPANRHVYVAGSVNDHGTMTVYDSNGNIVTTCGCFPNLGLVRGMAFDPVNDRIYVANDNPSRITVYDQDGKQIATSGAFNVSLPTGIAFDPSNDYLYVSVFDEHINQLPGEIAVYDQEGNRIATSGSFRTPVAAPIASSGVAFDPSNHRVYSLRGTGAGTLPPVIAVFDESGHFIGTSGTFPNMVHPDALIIVP